MNGRHIIAVLVGGLVAFIWSSISWMAIPWHQSTMNTFENEAVLGLAIKASALEPGIYTYPGWTTNKADMDKKHEEGPFVFASVVPAGCGTDMAPMMIRGFIIDIFACGLLLTLMLLVPDSGWKARALVAVVAALFVSAVPALMNWGWWHFPTGFTIVSIVDGIITWSLAGVLMAKIIAPKPVLAK